MNRAVRIARGRAAAIGGIALAPLLWVACARVSPKPEIHLHPLVRIEHRATSGTLLVRGLGPLIEWISTPQRSHFVARPLLRLERDYETGGRQTDVLWPLVRRAWKAPPQGGRRELELRILPLFRTNSHVTPSGEKRQSLIIFPLVFWGKQGEGGRYLIVFPFYWSARDARIGFPIIWNSRRSFDALVPVLGHFNDLWGNDEVWFLGWPLLIRTRKGEERGTWLFWPFVRWAKGKETWSLRLWPLGGVRTEGGHLTDAFWLWPLGHWVQKKGSDDYQLMLLPLFWKMRSGPARLSYYFPLFGRYQSPQRTTTSYLWPLLSHTIGHKEDYEEYRFLWLIGHWRRGAGKTISRVWPLAGRSVEPQRYDGFALWPLLQGSVVTEPASQVTRRWSLPFYWYQRRVWHDGSEKARWMFVPFARYEKDRNRTQRLRLLWPIWVADYEPIDTIYAPLWTAFDRQTVPGEHLHREILGSTVLLHRDGNGEVREINLPFVSWRRTPERDRFVLFGFVHVERERMAAGGPPALRP